MIFPPRTRRIVLALAVCALPMVASADAERRPDAFAGSTAHPWKIALARRLADEGMESRKERERFAKQALREWRRRQRAKLGGEHARPVAPDGSTPRASEPTVLRRLPRRFGTTTFTPPTNVMVNNPAGDATLSGQSETSIAAFGDIMVAAWNDFPGTGVNDQQGWGYSSDGGVTWVDGGVPPHPSGVSNFEWFSDPLVAVNDKTGAFYFAALCLFSNAQGSRNGVAVVKGRWNGTTIAWGNPVIAHEGALGTDDSDKEWLVADSLSGRVYLSYTAFVEDPVSHATLSRIMFASADSNVVTWTTPRQVSLDTQTENGFVQGSRPVVDGDGHVYVVYFLIGQGFADYYRIRRSDNQGASFGVPVTAESLYTNFGTGPPGFNREISVDFPGIGVDRSHGPHRGRVYLSWAESINWLDEVFVIGLNGDKSESEPNDNAATATPAVIGQTLRGTVSSAADFDYYAVALAQGQHIVISADSAEALAANQAGCVLRLLAGDGITALTFTTFDRSVNGGFPSGWMFTAPTSGTYYIQVGPKLSQGRYRLRTGTVHRDNERGRDQRDVFVGFSDDGLSWSTPVRVNEDPPGFDQFTPEVNAAPDGGVYCTWYDYRDSAPAKDGGEAGVYMAHSGDGGSTWTTLGPVADVLTDWSATGTNLIPNQGDYMSLFSSASYVWALWSDGRRGNPDVFSARTPLIPAGVQVATQNVHLADHRITIDWLTLPPDTLSMRLYRATDAGSFVNIDAVQFDAGGALTYPDTTVIPEHTYTYRLGRFTNGVELFYGQVSVFLPGSFALRMSPPRPNPIVAGTFVADFSLATDEPADLILFDITGREVLRRRVNLGKGPHTLTLPVPNGTHQGLYVLTLRQGGHNTSSRAYIVR